MWDILNNPEFLSIVGLLATLLFGLAAILVPIWVSRRRKRLWYWSSVSPVVHETWREKITILVDNDEEPDVYMCAIGMRYIGEFLEGYRKIALSGGS